MRGIGVDMEHFHNSMDSILAKKELPHDLDGINRMIESTQEEMRSAIMNGNSNLMVQLDRQMQILLARRFGADVAATKAAIDAAEQSKIKIAKEIELLREIKKQKNLAAGRAEQLFIKRMERVRQAELQIELANNRFVSARVAAKESKTRLQSLLDAKQKEQANAYERYEFSQY